MANCHAQLGHGTQERTSYHGSGIVAMWPWAAPEVACWACWGHDLGGPASGSRPDGGLEENYDKFKK